MRREHYIRQNLKGEEESLTLKQLESLGKTWQLDGQQRRCSAGTLANRRFVLAKLLWFLRREQEEECGVAQLRAFLAYLASPVTPGTERWGRAASGRELKPASVKFYYSYLSSFFTFVVEEGELACTPMLRVRAPIVRQDQILPFSEEQILELFRAARDSAYALRDVALVRFLLDTGCRASEAASLCVQDLDLQARRCQVLGKGNKRRTLYFGRDTARALLRLIQDDSGETAVFRAYSGPNTAEALTRSGITHIVRRLGREAGITAVRCSAHTFRHTFAVYFLRNGGNTFTLQTLLGHETLDMTQRYVRLAQADVEEQHRLASPVDKLRRR